MKENKSSKLAALPDKDRARRWVLYMAFFLAIFGALDYGYYLARDTVIERLIVDRLTVRPAAVFINLLFPAASAKASGHDLFSTFGEINIVQGCEGTEAMFLLIAAILPFPARLKTKVLGITGGVLLLYILNQLRLLLLMVFLHSHQDWFGAIHGLIAPTFIVTAGCLFFLAWVSAVVRQAA